MISLLLSLGSRGENKGVATAAVVVVGGVGVNVVIGGGGVVVVNGVVGGGGVVVVNGVVGGGGVVVDFGDSDIVDFGDSDIVDFGSGGGDFAVTVEVYIIYDAGSRRI